MNSEVRLNQKQVTLTNQAIIEFSYLAIEALEKAKEGGLFFEQANCINACLGNAKTMLKSVDPEYLEQHPRIKKLMGDTTMKDNKIVFELVQTYCFTRYPCHICGGCTEKVDILCEVTDGEFKGLRICECCLEAGKEKVDERLKAQIKSLEGRLSELKSFAGRLEFPTYAKWEERMKQAGRDHFDSDEEYQQWVNEHQKQPAWMGW